MRAFTHRVRWTRWVSGIILSGLLGGLPARALHAELDDEKMPRFTLTSSAFAHEAMIPAAYACDGADRSPPLSWTVPPDQTKSFALIVDDPDAPAGTWVHWTLYNLPATARMLPENIPKLETLPDGTQQGLNDFRRVGYGGPCPPPGPSHRYVFRLYALATRLRLPPHSTTRTQLERAMDGSILAHTELIGRYKR